MRNLADLDAFRAVAAARSYRGAARTRGVSASALSAAIRRLEVDLGVRLLNRTTRSVTPTEAGRQLLAHLAPALDEVDLALDALNGLKDSPTGTLRLNVPGIVARLILPDLVGPFLASHPGITLQVIVEDSVIDVLAAGFDAGVRYDERLDQDMIAVPLGPRHQRYAAAAAPAYLARHGSPDHPRALMHHQAVVHRFPSGAQLAWEFERAGETIRVTPPQRLVTSSSDIELAGALAGLGIIYIFEELIAPDFATGRLVPVLADWWFRFTGPFLYYPSRRQMPAALRAFVDYLKSRPDPSGMMAEKAH